MTSEVLSGTLGAAAGEPEAFSANVTAALLDFPASTQPDLGAAMPGTLAPILEALTPILDAASTAMGAQGAPQARHTKGKKLALSASPAASAVAHASSASVGGANLTVDAAIVAATAAGNGTTDPVWRPVLHSTRQRAEICPHILCAQENIAALLMTALGPVMEAIVPIVYVSAAAGAVSD
ncbi:hypothetical protein B0H17DRAFT_1197472 [Mycena rosella]|uniref:Uncharacterized protein n=1 Tax=Mycena rosella TaxID=1033263 RepID=A0AAD7DQL5_MYCRO|nr:hypothetical protein B0H17DRAFT_1197472 [Mycena rosella]